MRLEARTTIDRPVAEVFAFSTDIGNLALWAGPVAEATQTSEGPTGVGTTSTRVTQLLGRRFESDYEITVYQPNSEYAAKTTSGPVPIVETLSFEEKDGGTEVTIAGELEATGFFKLAEPILARITKRQVENDIATLKDLLEAQE